MLIAEVAIKDAASEMYFAEIAEACRASEMIGTLTECFDVGNS